MGSLDAYDRAVRVEGEITAGTGGGGGDSRAVANLTKFDSVAEALSKGGGRGGKISLLSGSPTGTRETGGPLKWLARSVRVMAATPVGRRQPVEHEARRLWIRLGMGGM